MNRRTIIIVLTVATTLIHLYLGFTLLNTLFILNGVGYLALLAGLYFLPQMAAQRGMIRYALMGFAAITIVAYFVVNGTAGFTNPLGIITKLIELGLIAMLWMDK